MEDKHKRVETFHRLIVTRPGLRTPSKIRYRKLSVERLFLCLFFAHTVNICMHISIYILFFSLTFADKFCLDKLWGLKNISWVDCSKNSAWVLCWKVLLIICTGRYAIAVSGRVRCSVPWDLWIPWDWITRNNPVESISLAIEINSRTETYGKLLKNVLNNAK